MLPGPSPMGKALIASGALGMVAAPTPVNLVLEQSL